MKKKRKMKKMKNSIMLKRKNIDGLIIQINFWSLEKQINTKSKSLKMIGDRCRLNKFLKN